MKVLEKTEGLFFDWTIGMLSISDIQRDLIRFNGDNPRNLLGCQQIIKVYQKVHFTRRLHRSILLNLYKEKNSKITIAVVKVKAN